MTINHPQPLTAEHDERLTRLWLQSHVILRVATVLLGTFLGIVAISKGHEPTSIAMIVTAMAVWTAVTAPLYIRLSERKALVIVDNAVTVALLILVGLFIPLTDRFSSVPVAWAATAPMAAAILRGLPAAPLAGIAVGFTALTSQPVSSSNTWVLLFGILVMSTTAGFFVNRIRLSMVERDRLAYLEMALAERQRLSRVVHDGTLQFLSLIGREAQSFGPNGVQLAKQAREQEHALRALLQDKDPDGEQADYQATRDLASVLDRYAGEAVTVSTMADSIVISKETADEVDAVVSEALSNVVKHAGKDAKAWILLERVEDELIISIRDNGRGADLDAVLDAERNGRIGVKQSIVGRISDLGGAAELRTAPGQGAEWEFRIPVSQ